MGFSAYILESLKQHGRAEVGPLGTFKLDYSPARWNNQKSNFNPPLASVSWSPSPNPNNMSNFNLLAQIVARLHDIPFEKAKDFVEKTIHKFNSSEVQSLKLTSLGILHKSETAFAFDRFEPDPQFQQTLQFDTLQLDPLRTEEETEFFKPWMISLLAALSLLSVYFLISLLASKSPEGITSPTIPPIEGSATAVKGTNLAPVFQETPPMVQTQDTVLNKMDTITIITGTFCKSKNQTAMRKKIASLGYTLYEEKLENNCIRLGVQLVGNPDPVTALDIIKSVIEPKSWILE